MSEKQRCAGISHGHKQCLRSATLEYEGKLWCALHHKPSKDLRDREHREKLRNEINLQAELRQKASEETAKLCRKIAAYDQMAVKLAEAKKDTARLDWLEAQGFETRVNYKDGQPMAVHSWTLRADVKAWTAHWISSEFTNCRDAIDAAMKGVLDEGLHESQKPTYPQGNPNCP